MKNFLNKLLFLIIFVLTLQTTVSHASRDSSFYQKLFKESDLKADFLFQDLETPDIDINKVSNNFVKTKSLEDTNNSVYINFPKKNPNLLLTTRELVDFSIINNLIKTDYERVFVVCNSKFSDTLFSCDFDSFNLLDMSVSEFKEQIFQDPDSNITSTLYKFEYEGKHFFIIPENSIQSSVQESMISNYLSSLNRSININSNQEAGSPAGIRIVIEEYFESISFETLSYVIVAFIILLFLYPIIIFIKNKNLNWNIRDVYTTLDGSFFGVYNKNIYLKAFYLFFNVSFFVSLYLIYRELADQNLNYFLEILSLNPFYELRESSYKNVIIYLFLISGILLVTSSRIEMALEIFRNLFRKISKAEIIPESLKYLFLFFYFCLIISVILFSKFKFTELLILVVLVNFYILYFFFKHKLSLRTLFKTKEKIIISIISLGIVLFGFWYDGIEFTSKYRFDNLIGLRDPIVMLPYNKQTTEEVLIDEINEYYNFPLFVDEYLVHYPGTKNIENKNIRDFENNKSSLIVSKSQDRLLKKLVENPNILPSLKYTEKSNIFLAPKISENINSQDLSLQFTIDCRSLNTTNLIARVYAKDSSGRARVQDIDLGNLLTCNSESKKYTFKVPKNLDLYVDSILHFKDLKRELFLNFEIIDSNKTLYTFNKFSIDFNNLYYYLDFRSEDKENIVAYMTEDNPDYSISSKVAKNTAEIINELKMKKFIKDSFNIWTLEPYQIIKNEYEIKEPLDSELLLNKN